MRRVLSVMSALALALVSGMSPAVAWNCPVQIKAAEDAIKKTETMKLGPDARALVNRARKLLEEARRDHQEAAAKIDHANAMWKAKAALAQADAAAAMSTP